MLDHNIIQYAYNEDGNLVSIYNVPNGRNSGCKCGKCGESLWAKNKGKTRDSELVFNQKTAHFYHPPESNCQGETLVHILAKEVLKKTKKLLFEFEIRNHRGEFIRNEERTLKFEEVVLEKNINTSSRKWIRPDAKGIKGDMELYIEFANSSYIEYKKEDLIKTKNLNVIEIELNVPHINWNDYQDVEELENKLTEFLNSNCMTSGNWINNYNFKSLLIDIIDTSEEELKEEEKRKVLVYQMQLMEVKKEIICDILRLGDSSKVIPVLFFEKKMHYLDNKHFIVQKGEVFILEDSYKEPGLGKN